VADSQGRDFFISYTAADRAWAEWIAVQLEAADLLGRLRDGWTRRAAVLVDAAEPRQVHDRFHDGLGCGGNAPGTGSRAARPRRAAVGYRRRHPAPAREGALMAENLDAEQYRQALRLVLGELEDLDTAHPVDIGYRLGELKVHLRTLIGESGQPPMVGFRGLEDLARVRKERLGPSSP
jgi:hypothetical protein